MKVVYNNPNDPKYYRWMDNNGIHDIWYLDKTNIYDYKKCDLPNELIILLDKWNEKMINLMTVFCMPWMEEMSHGETTNHVTTAVFQSNCRYETARMTMDMKGYFTTKFNITRKKFSFRQWVQYSSPTVKGWLVDDWS